MVRLSQVHNVSVLDGGTITGGVTIQGSVAANSILTPANIGGATATVGNASASIDDNGNAVFRSGSIGGFQIYWYNYFNSKQTLN